MKRPLSLTLAAAICACASLNTGAAAKMMTQNDAAKALKPVFGTWNCAGATKHTSSFMPLFSGKGMQINETVEGGNSSLNVFDTKRQKWINLYADGQGHYSVMEGTPVKGGIDFTAVYPDGFNSSLAIRFPSKKTMTSTMKINMNGELQTKKETCTKA